LGVGGWGFGPHPPTPNPQSPIPNPQSPIAKFEINNFYYIYLINIYIK